MRIFTLLVCLLIFCGNSATKAQGLTPSTVRQIFSLQKGDSLEYHIWTNAQICGTICNIYKIRIIDTIYSNVSNDSLFIRFITEDIHFDSIATNPMDCNYDCENYIDGLVTIPRFDDSMWTVANLDSSIIGIDTITYLENYGDSIISDPYVYNGFKQNIIEWGENIISNGVDNFADSLGVVYHSVLGTEAPDAQNEQLIYYHKANGSIWGTPSYYTGISNISAGNAITIYPNPAGDRFTVHTDLYQGLRFELFDMLSEQVISINLTGVETEMYRNDLPPGLYFWHVTDGVNVIKTGKLVLE